LRLRGVSYDAAEISFRPRFARRKLECDRCRAEEVPNVTPDSCEQRTLVLSAFPAEADAVLSHTTLDPNPVVVADRRHFYLGSIGGKKVIVAMTGIGLVNATDTTEIACARFSVGAVVFSG